MVISKLHTMISRHYTEEHHFTIAEVQFNVQS